MAMLYYFGLTTMSHLEESCTDAINQFVHVVAIYDGASMRLYLNGVLAASKSFSGEISHSTSPLLIGAAAGGFSFGGALDEVAVYRRGLSLFEVFEHYSVAKGL